MYILICGMDIHNKVRLMSCITRLCAINCFAMRWFQLIEVYEAALNGIDSGLCPVTRAEFIEQTAYMDTHRLFCDMQTFSNVPVALSAGNTSEYFSLTRC